MAIQLSPFGRDKPGDVEPHGGTHAHGLLEAGLQVGQVLGLVPREVAVGRDGAGADGIFELVHDGLVDALVVEDVPEEGLHGRGGRVGAGEAGASQPYSLPDTNLNREDLHRTVRHSKHIPLPEPLRVPQMPLNQTRH
jgi:hypothetical protein